MAKALYYNESIFYQISCSELEIHYVNKCDLKLKFSVIKHQNIVSASHLKSFSVWRAVHVNQKFWLTLLCVVTYFQS